jgi:hypothetical protein
MPLSIHLFIHFALAILVGYLIGRHFKKIALGVVCGFLGGFLIDLDHVLEYFLVYGFNFNLIYFLQGREFLLSDKIHLWFHAWEYVIILVILTRLFKKYKTIQVVVVTLACAISVHLLTDSIINKYPHQFYSLSHRWELNFSAQALLSPSEYQKNQESKYWLGL